MLSALGEYLEGLEYQNINIDFMPDAKSMRDVIYIGKWGGTLGRLDDAVHYIQIQVRRGDYDEAYSVCHELFKLLDSNREDNIETVIQLTDEVFCIATPRRPPIIMERGKEHVTFYYELALYGQS